MTLWVYENWKVAGYKRIFLPRACDFLLRDSFLKLVLTRGKQMIENKYSFQTRIRKLHHRTGDNHTLKSVTGEKSSTFQSSFCISLAKLTPFQNNSVLASLQRAFLTSFIRALILVAARFHACLRVVDFIFDGRSRSHETARSYIKRD